MYQLKFTEDVCVKCETYDCLTKCQYMKFDLQKAKEEKWKLIRGEDNSIIKGCITCYACEEYCPYNNHPFYLIVERMEKTGYHTAPKPLEQSQIIAMEAKGRIKQKKLKDPVINMCYFPMLTGSIKGELFKDASIVVGSDIFCNLMFLHFGRQSTTNERLPKVIDNLMSYYVKPNNLKSLICYHDECFGTYNHWADAYGMEVPFKTIHFFDYLYDRLVGLKSDIKSLNLKVAYQRPCSNRLCPETDKFVDGIFQLIGVERVKRKYDRENALCCGGILEVQQRFEQFKETQKNNIDDMKSSGATHCVFNCPFCFWTLAKSVKKVGIIPIMMSDLCQQALAE